MIPMVDSNADYAGGAIEISVIIAVSGRPIDPPRNHYCNQFYT